MTLGVDDELKGSGGSAAIDDLLTNEEVGAFGPAQALVFVLSGLTFVTVALVIFLDSFISPAAHPGLQPSAWACVRPSSDDPECAAAYQQVIAAAGRPDDGALRLAAQTALCQLQPGADYHWTHPYQFMTQELNLVCGDAWKASFVESLVFVGVMMGNGFLGSAADVWGRRYVIRATSLGLLVLGVLTALAPHYWLHAALRLAAGALSAGLCVAGYVMVTEFVGPVWRGVACILVQACFIAGEFSVAGAVTAFPRSWRGVVLLSALPPGLALILSYVCPESPRWLLTVGRQSEAEASLRWMARRNGGRLTRRPVLVCSRPDDDTNPSSHSEVALSVGRGASVDSMPALHKRGQCEEDDEEHQPLLSPGIDPQHPPIDTKPPQEQGLLLVLRHPSLARTFAVTGFTIMSLSMAYYGVTLALGSLSGDLRVNFLLTAAAELPAYVILGFAVDRLRRKPGVAAGAALAGVACVGVSFLSGGRAQVALAALGKFGASGAWSLGIMFAGELFPTSCRSSVLGVINQAGDLGGLLAPPLLLLSQHLAWSRLPFLVMGLLAFLAAGLLTLLPETHGRTHLVDSL